jgi:HAMP domain-containing protein
VPLFDIVMAGVEPREMGSASGVLQAVNSMSMALGVAGLGAVFFGLLNATAGHAGTFVSAAQWTVLATVALLACAFAVAFWLPRRAREMSAPGAAHEEATWEITRDKKAGAREGGAAAVLRVEPFMHLSGGQAAAVAEEGARLLCFAAEDADDHDIDIARPV